MAGSESNGCVQSMAIWFPIKQEKPTSVDHTVQEKPTSVDPTVDLHFNLWRMTHPGKRIKEKHQDFLDVGIMISNPYSLHSICFFLPMIIGRDNIKDLGPKFADPRLATAIFNEKLAVTNDSSGKPIILAKESDNSIYCRVINLPISGNDIEESAMEIEKKIDGTQITITENTLEEACKVIDKDHKLYIRFRIYLPEGKKNTFVSSHRPNDWWFASGFDVIECLDVRLNEARNLPDRILQKKAVTESQKTVKIKRLDFLLVAGVTADFIGGHRTFHKCRLLEKGIWENYIDERKLLTGMVIYHWKEPSSPLKLLMPKLQTVSTIEGLEDFNAFVKLRLRFSGKLTKLLYVLLALLIGATGGVVGNALWETFKEQMQKPALITTVAPTNAAPSGKHRTSDDRPTQASNSGKDDSATLDKSDSAEAQPMERGTAPTGSKADGRT